nr:unnamed protein product [Digitaria exilis]
MEANGGLGMDAISNETVDLEHIPVEEVFEHLKCTRQGLTADAAQQRINIFGYNKLEEKQAIPSPPPSYYFIEENNAGNAAAALMARLAPKAKALRDGTWSELDASLLVPGDIISIKLGDIIPADARLLEGDPLKIDQSALTGESLPVTKNPGDGIYSGSTCKQGEIEAVVIATGIHTFFGKAAHLVESTSHVGHFQKVLTSIGNFCICSIAVGMIIELIVMYAVHAREYRQIVDNLLVLLIGGIPIAMPTVLSVTMAIGSHKLAQQGAITKRMTAIEEMAGMDVLCSDKTGTLTLNKLSVDKNLIEVFARGMEKDDIVLMAARASRLENQDAIDFAIVSMLPDPKEARAGIQEVHFLPFNPTDKRTALTYIDAVGKMHRVSKGAPEQILNLASNKSEIERKVHHAIGNYAERGLRSLAVAYQVEVPEGTKESPGGPWQFVGLLPLFDPPRHDSAETISRALDLGVSVKMITGDQLAIAKETGRRLGMGTNMYPSSSLLGDKKGDIAVLPVDELIEQADGFAGVFPGTIMTISKDKVKPSPHPDSWKLAEIFATGVVIGAYLAVTTVLFFWAAYRTEFFVRLFHVTTLNIDKLTSEDKRGGSHLDVIADNTERLASAVYLQVSTISQALIFVTRSRGWSFLERPGLLLMGAFVIAQLIASVIAAMVSWDVAGIKGIGWRWTGAIWAYNLAVYLLLDPIKFAVRYGLSGKAWGLVIDRKVAFSARKDFGKEAREAAWAHEQRTMHGLVSSAAAAAGGASSSGGGVDHHHHHQVGQMAEDARRRAEIARLRELRTLKAKVESVVKRKGLDLDDINNQHYTV